MGTIVGGSDEYTGEILRPVELGVGEVNQWENLWPSSFCPDLSPSSSTWQAGFFSPSAPSSG